MKLKIAGTTLIIYMLLPYISFAQGRVIQGSITQKSDNSPLVGATIVETDNTEKVINATITDFNGHYVIKIKNPNNKLSFSFIGYISQTFEIGTKSTFDVQLAEDSKEILEIVIKADRCIL
jgi:hypothetical protein